MRSLVFLCILGLAVADNYNGYQLFRAVPETNTQVAYLSHLDNSGDYDFWRRARTVGEKVDIMASPWMASTLKVALKRTGIDYSIVSYNVQKILDEEWKANEKAREINGRDMDWLSYHTYDEINAWIDTLPGLYPGLVTVEDVGFSYENRVMKLVTVSANGGNSAKGIFVDGGIHAREWISPATVSFMLNNFLENNGDYADTLAVVDFYFMISINPDGYAFTFSDDRMWRKTRSPNAGSTCIGTDPNRNWDYMWGVAGASTLPCADTYMGETAFSEVECRNVRDQILRVSGKTPVYLTFHSYGQYILYPWGYTTVLADDWQDMDALGTAAEAAIEAVYGTQYQTGDSGALLYPAAGASDDWSKGVAGIKYAYTIELRPDTSIPGFQLPPEEIIPTGIETFEGFKVMFEFVRDY